MFTFLIFMIAVCFGLYEFAQKRFNPKRYSKSSSLLVVEGIAYTAFGIAAACMLCFGLIA